MRSITTYIIALSLLLATSCEAIENTLYDYPQGGGVDPTAIDLEIVLEIDLDLDFVFESTMTRTSEVVPGRVIIEFYLDKDPDSSDSEEYSIAGSEPQYRVEYLIDNITADGQDVNIDIKVAPKAYRVLMWVDCQSTDGGRYITERLYSIKIAQPLEANSDLHNAFYACKKVDLRPYEGQQFAAIAECFDLHRPFARYEFVTQDLSQYITKAATKNESPSAVDINLENYYTIITYSGYYPSGFNASTGSPNDAISGVSYRAEFTNITAESATIALDYVITNHAPSSVVVNVEIFDADDNQITGSYGITIPYEHNSSTRIFGNFMTTSHGSGVGINPDYDGEYNIYI